MTDYLDKTLAEVFSSIFLKVLQVASGFFTTFFLIHYLTVEEYGSFRFIYSLSAIFAYLASCGIEASIFRYIPEYIEKKTFGKCAGILIIGVTTRLLALIGLLGGTWIFQDHFFDTFKFPDQLRQWYSSVCLFILLSQTHNVFGLTFLSSCLHQRKSSAIESIAILIRLVCIGAVLYFDLGFKGVISYLVFVESILFLVYALFAIKSSLWSNSLGSLQESIFELEYNRIIKFSAYSSFLAFTAIARELAVDNMVIAHYLDITHVAIYSFAISILELLSSVNPSMFLKNIISHLFVRKFVATESLNFLDYANQFLIKLSCFFMLPIYTAVAILINPIVTFVFKSEYTDSIPIIYLLMVFFFMNNVLAYGVSHILFTLELNSYRLWGSLVTGIFNLVLDLILVPKIGLNGAAIATGLSGLFLLAYYYVVVHYLTEVNLGFPKRSIGKILFHSLVVGIILYSLRPFVDSSISLILALILGAILYLTLSICNKPFSVRDRALINKVSGRNLWVF